MKQRAERRLCSNNRVSLFLVRFLHTITHHCRQQPHVVRIAFPCGHISISNMLSSEEVSPRHGRSSSSSSSSASDSARRPLSSLAAMAAAAWLALLAVRSSQIMMWAGGFSGVPLSKASAFFQGSLRYHEADQQPTSPEASGLHGALL